MQTEKLKKQRKMTLKDYYESLGSVKPPKQTFIDTVVEKCGVRANTVRRWVYDNAKPQSEEHIKFLEELTGIERSELWK